jgi:hypothetical protein
LAQEQIEQYLDGLPKDEPGQDIFAEPSLPGLFETREAGFEWIITPEQFVDFWIAVIFILVGTWQIITMFFLVVG